MSKATDYAAAAEIVDNPPRFVLGSGKNVIAIVSDKGFLQLYTSALNSHDALQLAEWIEETYG